jgi:hypothetical protein
MIQNHMSAGESAGIDMTLELVAQEAGYEALCRLRTLVEYYPAGKTCGTVYKGPKAYGNLENRRHEP